MSTGQPAPPSLDRLRYPVYGIAMMFCIGNVYAWSVFRNPLMKECGWSMAEATLPFQISIAVFAVAMILAGRWQDRSGPRPVAMLGGLLIGTGFILAGLFGRSLAYMILSFGVVAGIGMGGAYVTPLATTIKWWPDRRGVMTGLVMLGMGAGATIGGIGGPRLMAHFETADATGVFPTFIVLGALFGVVITVAGSFLRTPPPGTVFPATPSTGADPAKPAAQHQFTPREMLSTRAFYLIWVTFLIGCGVGLMVISQVSPIGQEIAGLSPQAGGLCVIILSVFNGLGRLAFGALSDRIGRRNTFLVAFAIEAVTFLLILPNAASFAPFAVAVALIGFSFGAFMAVMPTITADYFGTAHVGVNYAMVYTAWGAAGILGPMVAVLMEGAWHDTFRLLSGLCLAGGVLMAFLAPPSSPRAAATA